MRSPLGPVLVIMTLGTIVVLVLLLFQSLSLRGDVERARADLAAVRAEIDDAPPPVTREDLQRRLDELESGIRDWLIATGADGFDPDGDSSPAGGRTPTDEILDRLDLVLQRIGALEDRLDELCESVPVC